MGSFFGLERGRDVWRPMRPFTAWMPGTIPGSSPGSSPGTAMTAADVDAPHLGSYRAPNTFTKASRQAWHWICHASCVTPFERVHREPWSLSREPIAMTAEATVNTPVRGALPTLGLA